MEKLRKPLLIACGGFVILFIFMFIISSCNKKKYTTQEFTDHLMKSAKKYYEVNKNNLPQQDGGKTSLNITTLVEKQDKYLKDTTCNGSIEIINNSGYYMYIPNISCSDGFKTSKLSDFLIVSDNIVSSGNGLYNLNNEFVFRGDNVNNYVFFNNQLWRIVKINNDGTIKMIETSLKLKDKKNGVLSFKSSKRLSCVWDDRYNVDKNNNSGFNDIIHEGINSRIKDTLDDIFKNDFTETSKGYIVKQNLCIGKRSVSDTINDGSIECSNILENQYIGLLQVNEFINASLDQSCVSAESVTCSNYNYLTMFNSSFWSITAVKDNTFKIFKLGTNINSATANSSSNPRIVINISNESRFIAGDGSKTNPYVLY